MNTDTVVCEMFRDGYGCDGLDKVYLIVNPDKTTAVLCAKCIEQNTDAMGIGTLIFEIGDDATNRYL